jgi:prolyl oligopeptidase
VTRAEVVRDTYFGVAVEDPYRWLEDLEAAEVRDWLAAQARYSRSVLDGLPDRASLRAELGQGGGAAGLTHLRVAGGQVFYLWQEAGQQVASLMVRSRSGGPARVLFDPAAMGGASPAALDWQVPSPDGRRVACGVSHGGSERCTVHVVDVAAAAISEAVLDGVAFPFIGWLADDDGAFASFVYHRYRDFPVGTPPDQLRLDSRSLRHRLGEDPSADVVVAARGLNPRLQLAERDRPFLVVSPSGRWTLALVSHSSLGLETNESLSDCTLYVAPTSELADPGNCPWQRVAAPDDDVVAYAFGRDAIHLVVGRDAARYQVITLSLSDASAQAPSQCVRESERVVEAVAEADGHVLVRDLDGGIGRVRRVAVGGGEPAEVELPINGTVEEWAAEPDDAEVLLRLSSWTEPPRVYRCDVRSGAVTDTGWIPASPSGSADIVAEEVQVLGRDGTSIPLSLIHRAGLRRDADNPTLLTAYGSHGYPLRPAFQPEMLPWCERGGVFAVAHVRGGGEHGRDWHEAGRGVRKETTINDFIDCAEYLIANRYTRPERLAAEGGSAGGITVGGAMVRRPELFAAVVLQVPVTNALRVELGANGPMNVPELGSATTEEGLRGLLVMDCYLRVRDGTRYPAVLLTGGVNDPRVDMWQPAKMAARLQAASTSGRPVLLRVDQQGGHGFGATQSQRDDELADIMAFLLDQLDP